MGISFFFFEKIDVCKKQHMVFNVNVLINKHNTDGNTKDNLKRNKHSYICYSSQDQQYKSAECRNANHTRIMMSDS